MNEPGEPLLWYRRIGFRLALGLAALLLAAYYVVLPKIHDLSLRLFGLPGTDQRLVRIESLPPPTGSIEELGEAQLFPRDDLDFVAHHLLVDAVQEAPGRWLPTPERRAAVDEALRAHRQTYAWLDADRRVVYASSGLPLKVDEVIVDPAQEDGSTLGRAHGGVALGRVASGVWKEGEFAGWLLIAPAAPRGARGDGSPDGAIEREGEVLLEEAAYERTRRWSDRVLNLASTALFAAMALGLSLAASRMVTRRVTRLARQAAAPVDDPAHLPGPFEVAGGDEIATLARSMNGMRARVKGLLQDLERRDRDRRRWIAQVSHDLRTPLTALSACLERAEAELDGDPATLAERLAVARLDAERLSVLLEDLLDIARLETDEPLVAEPVPPGELVRQTARTLRGLADKRQVDLTTEVEPGLSELRADGRRLMRALENLLRNALQHAAGRVNVAARRVDGALRFEVTDDGPGLPQCGEEVDLAALGEHKSRQDSAGLGLVVVRKVAEAHGGATGARNLPEGGAAVWFEVPAPT